MPPAVILRAPRGYSVRPRPAALDTAAGSGLEIVERTARRLRLWGRLRNGTATEDDRRRLVERIGLDARLEVRNLTARLIDGTLRRDAWERKVGAVITPGFYAGSLTLLGSLDAADRAEIDREVAAHLAYLRRFRVEAGTGDQALHGGAQTRADLYPAAIWTAAQNAVLRRGIRAGDNQGIRILGIADHCRTKHGRVGCIEEADKGWQPIGKVTPLGNSPCHTRCHCRIQTRRRKVTRKTAAPAVPAASRPPLGRRILELPGKAARAIVGGARRLIGR